MNGRRGTGINRSAEAAGALMAMAVAFFCLAVHPAAAETEVRANLELYNTLYRGRAEGWYYSGNGKADIRFASTGNVNMRSEVSVEFYPVDLSGAAPIESTPAVTLKRLWVKANFPSWRLTVGKTKVAWGNGYVFNSGDVLFGSLGPYVDFTQSTIRDDTAWLTAVNIPTGRFSYLEAVILPPAVVLDGGSFDVQGADRTSGGLRYFATIGGWNLETGYLYKGDAKAPQDILGHRPYLSFHGHAGVDWYGAISLAAGWDAAAREDRDTWDEVKATVNASIGAYHQFRVGYENTMTLRLETLLLPWQNWSPKTYQDLIDGDAGYYGLFFYPEVTLMIRSDWFVGAQAVISPVDASAQITASAGWNVFQGFTLLGFVVVNAGGGDTLFAWDRTASWPDYPGTTDPWADFEFNGVNFTLGARYRY